MAYSKKTWVDRQVEHPGRRKLTSTGTTDVYDVTREEGLVIEEGDALNASTFNDLENRIYTAFNEASIREVYTLTHQKSSNVHQLTGLTGVTGTVSCVFTATAAFAAGDTFTVDGTPYTIQLSNGETAEDNLFVAGASVPLIVDTGAKKVNFKAAGSGTKLPAETTAIVASYIANGTFLVPETGRYRITTVGKGGDGGRGYEDSGGGGGASGGWSCSELDLTKGQSYPITVTASNSSFGSLLSATAGQDGQAGQGYWGSTGAGEMLVLLPEEICIITPDIMARLVMALLEVMGLQW